MKTTGYIARATSKVVALELADAIEIRFPFAALTVEAAGVLGWEVVVHDAGEDLWTAIAKLGAEVMILAYSRGAA